MLLIILCVLAEDSWPSDVEIQKAYAAPCEKHRPIAIEQSEARVARLQELVREARMNRSQKLRRLTDELSKESVRLRGLKDKSLRSDPPLWHVNLVGYGGLLIAADGLVVIDEIIDGESFVALWEKPTLEGGEQRAIVIRTPTATMKPRTAYDKTGKAFWVAGIDSHNGKQLPVLIPIK